MLQEEGGQQSFVRWFENTMAAKSLKRWQAKALHLRVPKPAVLNSQSKMDVGKLLYLKYAAVSKPGTALSGDLKDRDHFICDETEAWLGQ